MNKLIFGIFFLLTIGICMNSCKKENINSNEPSSLDVSESYTQAGLRALDDPLETEQIYRYQCLTGGWEIAVFENLENGNLKIQYYPKEFIIVNNDYHVNQYMYYPYELNSVLGIMEVTDGELPLDPFGEPVEGVGYQYRFVGSPTMPYNDWIDEMFETPWINIASSLNQQNMLESVLIHLNQHRPEGTEIIRCPAINSLVVNEGGNYGGSGWIDILEDLIHSDGIFKHLCSEVDGVCFADPDDFGGISNPDPYDPEYGALTYKLVKKNQVKINFYRDVVLKSIKIDKENNNLRDFILQRWNLPLTTTIKKGKYPVIKNGNGHGYSIVTLEK